MKLPPKSKKCKKVSLNRFQKGHLLTAGKLKKKKKTKKGRVALSDPPGDMCDGVLQFFATLHIFTNVCKSTIYAYWLGDCK